MSGSFAFPDFDLDKTDRDVATMEEIYGHNKKKENIFLDTFKEKMQENLKGGFLGQSQKDTRKYDIYGDRRRSSGDTVADLGGGNTAINPDTQTLINTQLAMANQPNQGRMAGQQLGGALGSAAGASLLAGAGGIGAAGLGTVLGTAALGPLGALAGGALGGLFG